MFDSILVANRGEIALRVMRTARALGYRTVAVYSEADALAPHVRAADDAVLLGPAPAAQSYLDIERVVEAARASGATAIHPGYGFLSENAGFARACEEAGLVFIGPPAAAIERMGNKAGAKRLMLAAGVPCVPGYQGEDQSDAGFTRAAGRIGYPLMVKAAAGGGGRGMRLVHEAAALGAALRSARSEALNAFASDELILERALLAPRHVEIQVFADAYGAVIHLGERDCSVQRRHQKVLEESPCPVVDAALRTAMGEAAVAAARAIGYRGAGTVEFLLDAEGRFYFLEMNTRLQVEHPVTEMVTGLDLVALQLRVAAGQPLGIAQGGVQWRGHAIEARLYAEDPTQDFLPMTGTLARWEPPTGEGIRVDAGVASGQVISPFYDPLLAKIIAWGEDRGTAIARLAAALEQTRAYGLVTNRGFLVEALRRPRFAAGEASTAFIAEEFPAALRAPEVPQATDVALAAVLQFRLARGRAVDASLGVLSELLDWHSGTTLAVRHRYATAGMVFHLGVRAHGGDRYTVSHAHADIEIELECLAPAQVRLRIDGRRVEAGYLEHGTGEIELAIGARTLRLRDELAHAALAEEAAAGGRISAPMHGVLIAVQVIEGERVVRDQPLAVLEAMKMQHELRAPLDGRVRSIAVKAGAQVAAGEMLLEIEAEAPVSS